MNWLKRLFNRRRMEADLEKELEFHLDEQTRDALKNGADEAEARRAARLAFGTLDGIKEECHDARGTRWLEDFVQDCRYGLRVLRRSPVFTAVAILSLGLGIGANTAIFSLMDRVMFRMLPGVREPRQLVEVGPCCFSYPMVSELAKLTSFDGIFARMNLGVMDIVVDGHPETAQTDLVSASYYSALGVKAAAGRAFSEDAAVAVISHPYWKRRFAADPAVIGRTFRRLNSVFTIVGVTPPEFFGTTVGQQPDIAIPLSMEPFVRGGPSYLGEQEYWWLAVMGRLKPSVTVAQAQAEIEALRGDAVDAWRANYAPHGVKLQLQPGGNGFDSLRERYSEPLTILMFTVGMVLLLACANLANLLLAKSAARQREIAVRLAIGARRGRVIRQLFVEGMLLSLGGAILGVAVAYVFADNLLNMTSLGGPRMPLDVRPDARVLLFALVISVVACVLFSLAPALHATRRSVRVAIANSKLRGWRLGRMLIGAQMAISVVLLVGAGLFGRTILNFYTIDAGFDARDVTVFSSNLAFLGFDSKRVQTLQAQVLASLNAMPGVHSATVSKYPPVSRGSWQQGLMVQAQSAADGKPDHLNSVGPKFFETYGTPLVSGREFDDRDTETSPRVAIVNESFARRYVNGSSPVGQWVAFKGREKDVHYTIVGVVKDARYESLRTESPATVYFSSAQVPPGASSHTFAVRMKPGVVLSAAELQNAFARVDPSVHGGLVLSLSNHVARSLMPERMLATLGAFFALLALMLSAIGVYGMMAFQVARQRREIGIRMALGADARSVVRMILRETTRLTVAGCLIGAVAGLVLTRGLQQVLYGIQPHDPATFAAAILVLLLVSLLASYLPGRTAARTNPIDTLRSE